MSPREGDIAHVSDTALMVAACRAKETSRPDGFVRDPFAERLAGARGLAILEALPRPDMMCFGIGVRSRFIDELVMQCAHELGVESVLSIGCGLDARPWRLELPPALRWVESDFPDVLEYKANLMASDPPKCLLEQRPVDLNDHLQRTALFSSMDPGNSLMITEGLLMYLAAETVAGIAADGASAGVQYWISDITSPAFAQMIGMDSYTSIQQMRADGHLDGVQILDTLHGNGWQTVRLRSYVTDLMEFAGERIAKAAAAAAAKPARPVTPVPPDDPTGVHLFGRQ